MATTTTMFIYSVLDEITQAILLIIGGVHQNPGPIARKGNQLLVKTQNVRGMVQAAKKNLLYINVMKFSKKTQVQY